MKFYLLLTALLLMVVSCTPDEEYDTIDIKFDSTATVYRHYQKPNYSLINVHSVYKATVTKNGVVVATSENDTLCSYLNNSLAFRRNGTGEIWKKIVVAATNKVNFGKDSLAITDLPDNGSDLDTAVIKYNLKKRFRLPYLSLNAFADTAQYLNPPADQQYSRLEAATSAKDIRKIDSLLAVSSEYYTYKKWKAEVKSKLINKYF